LFLCACFTIRMPNPMDTYALISLLLLVPLPLFTFNTYAEMFAGVENTSVKASIYKVNNIANWEKRFRSKSRS
jgi:hypothetical protein